MGRPEGDAFVAHIVRKKSFFEVHGYKPYYEGK
jgi:hypothetical protein